VIWPAALILAFLNRFTMFGLCRRNSYAEEFAKVLKQQAF